MPFLNFVEKKLTKTSFNLYFFLLHPKMTKVNYFVMEEVEIVCVDIIFALNI